MAVDEAPKLHHVVCVLRMSSLACITPMLGRSYTTQISYFCCLPPSTMQQKQGSAGLTGQEVQQRDKAKQPLSLLFFKLKKGGEELKKSNRTKANFPTFHT